MADERDEYNGWSNRETWAVNLWLSNDQGMYSEACRIIKDAEDAEDAEEKIKEYVEDLKVLLNEEGADELKGMFNDIGSMWRVNWKELVEAWR